MKEKAPNREVRESPAFRRGEEVKYSEQRSRPSADVRRRGAVYGIPCWAVDERGMPAVGQVVVGYVGKSRQTVKQREEQHRDSQSFSDLIVGGSWTIEEGWWTDAELDEREQYYIRHGVALTSGQAPQRPVYNYEFNTDNPDRIEIWRAVEHRQAREPGWVPPPKGDRIPRPRRAGPPSARVRAPRSRLARWWVRRRLRVALVACLWVALVVGLWIVGGDSWPGWDAPRNSAVGATLALVGVAVARSANRRPRRRRRSRRRR